MHKWKTEKQICPACNKEEREILNGDGVPCYGCRRVHHFDCTEFDEGIYRKAKDKIGWRCRQCTKQAVNCNSCEEKIENKKGVTCYGGCFGNYHFQCEEMEKKAWDSLTHDDKEKWRCQNCINEGNSIEDDSEDEDKDEICGNCEIAVEDHPNKKVRCGKCKLVYHNSCCGVSENTQKGKSKTNRKIWNCLNCRPGSSSASRSRSGSKCEQQTKEQNEVSEGASAVTKLDLQNLVSDIIRQINLQGIQTALESGMDTLKNGQKEIKDQLEDQGKKLQNVENEVNQLKTDAGNIKATADKNSKELEEWKIKFENLEKKFEEQQKQIDEMKKGEQTTAGIDWRKEKAEMKQYSRRENLEVHNVPETENENLEDVFKKICNSVGVYVESEDISAVHRLRQKEKNRPPPFIVRFVNRKKKVDIMEARKGKIITQDRIFGNGSGELIFINDNIEPYYKNLLLFARKKLKKENGWEYIWFKNDAVLAKKTAQSKTCKIVHEEQIVKLVEKDNQNLSRRN